ncbi:LuxR C-terminal-related transcriptional regulator [Mycobacteroides chelonae]|uniref:LuxR C-terminal-related transcriptional regulator n=1 Tax=Mycobacteroides chelonae TaxID=1774 RepID=UPI001C2C30CA|nr:LuxR C-terminal-related transcriptional regulator [Mycobacteroides chelonae]MBV0918737.1 LuxR C-terminal-related transcriptional regulator [Mycobacteroides chelonae]
MTWRSVPWYLATQPTANPEMIDRPAIGRLIEAHLCHGRTVVVVAPSGFGKTVAVGQWAAQQEQGSVAWLAVTERTYDFGELVRGIVAALRQAIRSRGDDQLCDSLTAAFELSSPVLIMVALSEIEMASTVTIVVDDVHKANAALKDPLFIEFLEHGPEWLRLILIAVGALDAPLVRLRAYGRVANIGARELVFTREDVRTAASVGGPVTEESADAIFDVTGGWPAAVRLALVGRRHSALATDFDLAEYIRSAVLEQLRPELADFISATSVCASIDERLARVLSGRQDAAKLLAECVSSGLFIERFESSEGTVYQWHSMFAAHCRNILRQSDAARWKTLNTLAVRELRDQHPMEAVGHAIQAEDADAACDVITTHWLEMLLQCRTAALDRACTEVSESFGESAEIVMIRACCRELAGDRLGAQTLLSWAQSMAPSGTVSRRLNLIDNLSQILTSDDYGTMAAAVDSLVETLGDPEVVPPRVYACALFLAGWTETRLRRNVSRSARLLEAALHECRALRMTEVTERVREHVAVAYAHSGEFSNAERILQDSDDEEDAAVALKPWLMQDGVGTRRLSTGFIQFWRGALPAALEDFLSIDNSLGTGYPDVGRMMVVFCTATLARRGVSVTWSVAEAAAVRISETNSRGLPLASFRSASLALLAEARVSKDEAVRLAAGLTEVHAPMASAVVSGMCRRVGDPVLARTLAVRALGPDTASFARAYALLILALLDWDSGRSDSAHALLEDVLALASTESILYPVVDNADAGCRELLAAHVASTAYPRFLAECLLACEAPDVPGAVSPLTSREREVLAYMRTPMTAAEIAGSLSISVSTLKTHQRAIYRKLRVANRREAIGLADMAGPGRSRLSVSPSHQSLPG